VKFKSGNIADRPRPFRLKSPAKGDGFHGTRGVSVSFSVNWIPLYDIFIPIRVVDKLGPSDHQNLQLNIGIADVVARRGEPRMAKVMITGVDDWQIQWEIKGDAEDGISTPLTQINANLLKEAYEKSKIKESLTDIAKKTIWASITDAFDLPPQPEFAADAKECMQKAMCAGWTLYDLLSADPVFKKVLRKLDNLPDGSKITIKTQGAAFPWELLYPLPYVDGYPEENYRPKRFWGARFQIESLLVVTEGDEKPPARSEQPGTLRISMGMNKSIDDDEIWQENMRPVQLQRNYFDVALEGRGVYFDRYEDILKIVRQPDPSSLIYFFCHGSEMELIFDDERGVITPQHVMGDSYPSWRVIFVNACDAGDISPLSFNGFRKKFPTKKAFGIVAPSYPIPTMFAAVFGNAWLREYMQRRPIGEILLDLRGQLLARNNPLGLWYSLQCPLDVSAPSHENKL
jgi:hypothetical protein